jgi:hypothetical protein
MNPESLKRCPPFDHALAPSRTYSSFLLRIGAENKHPFNLSLLNRGSKVHT